MQTVLFLCTGNYYRSRFAESYFNHHAPARLPAWRAESAGLQVDFEQKHNIGPLSPDAIAALDRLSIPWEGAPMPRDCSAALLGAADRVVCLLESEHRPMMETRFAADADRAVYWQVRDQPPGDDYDPMQHTAELVEGLMSGLQNGLG